MTPAFLLLAAAVGQTGAQATAVVSARIIPGERITLAAPRPAPGRQLREVRISVDGSGMPRRLRLIEFQ